MQRYPVILACLDKSKPFQKEQAREELTLIDVLPSALSILYFRISVFCLSISLSFYLFAVGHSVRPGHIKKTGVPYIVPHQRHLFLTLDDKVSCVSAASFSEERREARETNEKEKLHGWGVSIPKRERARGEVFIFIIGPIIVSLCVAEISMVVRS